MDEKLKYPPNEEKEYWKKVNLMLHIICGIIALLIVQEFSWNNVVGLILVYASSQAIFEYLKRIQLLKINAYLLGILTPICIIIVVQFLYFIAWSLFQDIFFTV